MTSASEQPAASSSHCAWCGTRIGRRYYTCRAHRDLEMALRAYYSPRQYRDLEVPRRG